jgi:hydrogenase maturation protease
MLRWAMANENDGWIGKNNAPLSSTLILGVGNILLGDEGVGVRVVETMKEMDMPDNVELIDGGTGAFDLLDVVSGHNKVIIIDAVQGNDEPGAIYRFYPGDIGMQRRCLTSVHQVNMLDALSLTKLTGNPPKEIIVFGIEPKNMEWGLELSAKVQAVIPRVIELVMDEL